MCGDPKCGKISKIRTAQYARGELPPLKKYGISEGQIRAIVAATGPGTYSLEELRNAKIQVPPTDYNPDAYIEAKGNIF